MKGCSLLMTSSGVVVSSKVGLDPVRQWQMLVARHNTGCCNLCSASSDESGRGCGGQASSGAGGCRRSTAGGRGEAEGTGEPLDKAQGLSGRSRSLEATRFHASVYASRGFVMVIRSAPCGWIMMTQFAAADS